VTVNMLKQWRTHPTKKRRKGRIRIAAVRSHEDPGRGEGRVRAPGPGCMTGSAKRYQMPSQENQQSGTICGKCRFVSVSHYKSVLYLSPVKAFSDLLKSLKILWSSKIYPAKLILSVLFIVRYN